MRNQSVINEKIKQAMLNRVALGIHKGGKSFKKGYDPRRRKFTIEDRQRGGQTIKEKSKIKFETTPFELLSKKLKRRRICIEQDFKCLHCKNSMWMNQPILLELDHIDGNKQNNTRKNLRCLCPNCHSQTPTWKSKNKISFKEKKAQVENRHIVSA